MHCCTFSIKYYNGSFIVSNIEHHHLTPHTFTRVRKKGKYFKNRSVLSFSNINVHVTSSSLLLDLRMVLEVLILHKMNACIYPITVPRTHLSLIVPKQDMAPPPPKEAPLVVALEVFPTVSLKVLLKILIDIELPIKVPLEAPFGWLLYYANIRCS